MARQIGGVAAFHSPDCKKSGKSSFSPRFEATLTIDVADRNRDFALTKKNSKIWLGILMKKSVLTAAAVLTLATAPVFAGSVADPVVESDIVVADVNNSSSGTAVITLLTIAMLVAVVSD